MKMKVLTWMIILFIVVPSSIYSAPFLIIGAFFFVFGFLHSPIEFILMIVTNRPDSIWNPSNFLSLIPTAVPLGAWGIKSLIDLSTYYVSKKPYFINKQHTVFGLVAGSICSFQIIMYSWSITGVKSLYYAWPLLAAIYFSVLLFAGIKTNAEQQP